jgi:hypothetical protein
MISCARSRCAARCRESCGAACETRRRRRERRLEIRRDSGANPAPHAPPPDHSQEARRCSNHLSLALSCLCSTLMLKCAIGHYCAFLPHPIQNRIYLGCGGSAASPAQSNSSRLCCDASAVTGAPRSKPASITRRRDHVVASHGARVRSGRRVRRPRLRRCREDR